MSVDFHDVRLPTDVSYGAVGGVKYKTNVVTSDAGIEQRFQRWDACGGHWQLNLAYWDDDRLDSLVSFFHARIGSAFGFRMRDWSDWHVGMVRNPDGSWSVPDDEEDIPQFAIGDGSTQAFQLTKIYTSGPGTTIRGITRPVTSTFKVYIGTTEQETGWDLDDATGILTFDTAPASLAAIRWAGEFDCPVRFESDDMSLSIEAVRSGDWQSVGIVMLKEKHAVNEPLPVDPILLGGLRYWFDAQDISTLFQDDACTVPVAVDADPVGGWVDKANGQILHTISDSKPEYGAVAIDGFPGVVSDGNSVDMHLTNALVTSQPCTVYIVAKADDVSHVSRLLGNDYNTLLSTHFYYDINGTGHWTFSRGGSAGGNIDTADSGPHAHCIVANDGSDDNLYIDRVLKRSEATGSGFLYNWSIFASFHGDTSTCFEGSVGEILVYDGAHDASKRSQVFGYLMGKWGIS